MQVKSLINHANIIVSKESQNIEKINPKEEKEVTFEFDIKRETPVNKKDTVEFLITGGKGIYVTKQFILSYTAPKD